MLKRSSSTLRTWVAVIVGALVLALCAFFILPSFSPDPTFAQTPGPIEYAENSDVDEMPVRTFTSEDPEGAGINWDVTGIDADDFTISGGVLKFKKSPNYEKPTDRMHGVAEMMAADNMYQITIRASEMRDSGDMGRALSTETHVTVEVTNEPEDGMVTIDLRQPEVGTPIRATVTDPDGDRASYNWTWYVSTVTNPVDDADNHWAEVTGTALNQVTTSYTPDGVRARTPVTGTAMDEGKYLRAVALYTDRSGTQQRKAIGVSEFPVRAEVSTDRDVDSNPENGSPGFTQGADYTRTVSESLGKGMNVEAPVVATEPNSTEPNDRGPNDPNHVPSSDKLTYEIDDDRIRNNGAAMADASYFSIDKTSGQLMVKKTLDWDMNPNSTNAGREVHVLRPSHRPQRRRGARGSDGYRHGRQRRPDDNGKHRHHWGCTGRAFGNQGVGAGQRRPVRHRYTRLDNRLGYKRYRYAGRRCRRNLLWYAQWPV